MALLWNRIEQRLAWCMTFCLHRFVLSAILKKTLVANILPWVNSFRAGSDLKISSNPKENHIAVLFFLTKAGGQEGRGLDLCLRSTTVETYNHRPLGRRHCDQALLAHLKDSRPDLITAWSAQESRALCSVRFMSICIFSDTALQIL